MVGGFEVALVFVCVAVVAAALDQLSTYRFARASVSLYSDPGKKEGNRLPRWFMRRYGVPGGNWLYLPIEVLLVTALTEVTFQSCAYFLRASPSGQTTAFWISLLIPLIDCLFIVPSNLRLAGRLERELVSRS